MKNLSRVLAFVLLTGTIISCSKQYNCECVTDGAGSSSSETLTSGKNLSREEAKSWCESNGEEYTIGTDSYVTECSMVR